MYSQKGPSFPLPPTFGKDKRGNRHTDGQTDRRRKEERQSGNIHPMTAMAFSVMRGRRGMGMCMCAQFLMPFFWYSTALSRKSAVCVTIDRARLPSFHYDIRILLFSFAFCFLFFLLLLFFACRPCRECFCRDSAGFLRRSRP